jgi:hypothetical protein
MANPRSKRKPSTASSQIPLQICEQKFSTVGEIVAWMVDGRFRLIHPEYSPRTYIASRLNMSESNLSLIINNQRPIDTTQFCAIADLCKAPEAFRFLSQYTFPDNIKILGEVH